MKKLLLLCAIIAGLTINALAGEEDAAIIAAARSYVTANAAITVKIALTVEAIEGDFARVKLVPEEPGKGDPAWVFVQKKEGKWVGITLGTSLTTEDYQ